METSAILDKTISFYPNIWTKTYRTITLFEALNSIRTGTYDKQIKNIRQHLSNGNIESYKIKKKQLPAFIFSGLAHGDKHKSDISDYPSLIVVDIDELENVELIKSQLKSDNYVVCVWKSPSGNGLKALFCLEFAETVKKDDYWIIHEHCAFPQIANYLLCKHNISIDKTGADITRLCFVSSDSEIHLKKEFEPFMVHITLNDQQKWNIRAKYSYYHKSIRNSTAELNRISVIPPINHSPHTTAGPCINCSDNEIKELYNVMQHIYSRLLIRINSVDYEPAEQLILLSQELIIKANAVCVNNKPDYLEVLINRFSEIYAFFNLLKSIQGDQTKQKEALTLSRHQLPIKFKAYAINNLINKEALQNIVDELKSENIFRDSSHRNALIENAKYIVSHGFRGAGCSSLRKWARHTFSTINIQSTIKLR